MKKILPFLMVTLGLQPSYVLSNETYERVYPIEKDCLNSVRDSIGEFAGEGSMEIVSGYSPRGNSSVDSYVLIRGNRDYSLDATNFLHRATNSCGKNMLVTFNIDMNVSDSLAKYLHENPEAIIEYDPKHKVLSFFTRNK
ncbi:hypothetical protein [Ferrimonas balearica]|uniref:hypothetical protein n=1 Tax=Ferrimonas balearica TaxID=44012 RepID=UPI001C986DB5|nr:hypothetical protein [Ferrimonas balearica]MBY5982258.1 hypothetical protein [Ferrimonas balearica]